MQPHSQRAIAHHYRRLPRRQRVAVYAVSLVLWASGVLWLILDEFFAHAGQFGRTPHPLESPLLLVHGVVAIASAYLLGWVSARHVWLWWTAGQRRLSGATLATLVAVLALSGFALFFLSSDQWQRLARLVHEVLGTLIVVCAVQHWFRGRRAARGSSVAEAVGVAPGALERQPPGVRRDQLVNRVGSPRARRIWPHRRRRLE